jgi:hypothetical protein
MNKVCFCSNSDLKISVQSQDHSLSSRINSVFLEFTQLIQSIPIKTLPLLPQEVEFVNQRIDKFHLDPDLKPKVVDRKEAKLMQDSPYKIFDSLPEEMMKLCQTSFLLKKILNETNFSDLANKLRRKGVLISPDENQDSSQISSRIDEWKQKGVLMTDRQLSKATNIYANHQFAKIERKILEKVFT